MRALGGFGKLWARTFLEQGDRVAATVRKLPDLEDLVIRIR